MSAIIRRGIVAFALAAAIPGVAMAEVATRSNWIPGTSGLGDVWTFSCPAGGNFDLTIQNMLDGVGHTSDLAFFVLDSAGATVVFGDDEITCSYLPSCGACAQELNAPCTAGGTYSIQVYSVIVCGLGAATGAGYELSLEVSDSANVALTAKKTKLGGGPKSKVPSWHSATSAPAVDDAKLN